MRGGVGIVKEYERDEKRKSERAKDGRREEGRGKDRKIEKERRR